VLASATQASSEVHLLLLCLQPALQQAAVEHFSLPHLSAAQASIHLKVVIPFFLFQVPTQHHTTTSLSSTAESST
jgi:hypothetical protein